MVDRPERRDVARGDGRADVACAGDHAERGERRHPGSGFPAARVRLTLSLLIAAIAAVGAVAFAPPAGALVRGDCEVSIARQTLTGRSVTDVDAAIEVDVGDEIVVEGRTARPGGPHRVRAEIAGVGVTLASGRSDSRSWSRVVDVDEYARHSLGLHRVEVEAPGCRATALVKVSGHPPVLTTLGGASLGAVVAGLVSVVLAWSRGRRPGRLRARSYRVTDPLDHLDELADAAEYVGWAEVLGDRQGRALVDDAPPNREILRRLRSPEVQERLDTLRGRGLKRFPMFSVLDPLGAVGAVGLLPRVRWRPRFPVLGTILTAAGAVGGVLLLQQFAVLYPGPDELTAAAAGGALLTVAVANLARTIGVRRSNRALSRAEESLLGEEAEPLYPPFEQSESGWTPTHAVPSTGMAAWATPDPGAPPVAQLDGTLPVEVVQRAGEWAWVLCSNGWTGWVDHRLLVPLVEEPATPPPDELA